MSQIGSANKNISSLAPMRVIHHSLMRMPAVKHSIHKGIAITNFPVKTEELEIGQGLLRIFRLKQELLGKNSWLDARIVQLSS